MAQDRIDRMLVQIDNAICTGRTGSQYEAAAKTLYQLVAEHRALEAVARAAEESVAMADRLVEGLNDGAGGTAQERVKQVVRGMRAALAALREVRRG